MHPLEPFTFFLFSSWNHQASSREIIRNCGLSYKISGKTGLLIITFVILGAGNSRTGTSWGPRAMKGNSAVMDRGKEPWRWGSERWAHMQGQAEAQGQGDWAVTQEEPRGRDSKGFQKTRDGERLRGQNAGATRRRDLKQRGWVRSTSTSHCQPQTEAEKKRGENKGKFYGAGKDSETSAPRQWIGLSGRRWDAKSLKWTTARRQGERVKLSSHDIKCHVSAQGFRCWDAQKEQDSEGKSKSWEKPERCRTQMVHAEACGKFYQTLRPMLHFVLLELFFCHL